MPQKSLTERLENIRNRVEDLQGGLTSESDINATSDDRQLMNIQNQLSDTLSNTISQVGDLGERERTIKEKFRKRRQLAEEAAEAERGLVESRFGERIEETEEAGQRKITNVREQQRGFAQSPRGLEMITENTQERVRDLKKDRDELLMMGKIAEAERLDNLIAQEETTLTSARSKFLSNLFDISGELRSQLGFETPEEADLQELKSTYADIPGVLDATTVDEALEAVKPELERQRSLQERQEEADLALTQTKLEQALQEDTDDAPKRNAIQAALTVTRDANEALTLMKDAGSFSDDATGIFSTLMRKQKAHIPGTRAFEIERLIQSIKDNVGIDTLLNIKREGSGLGQVPQSQLETLQGILGRLDIERSPQLLKRDIKDVNQIYQSVLDRAEPEVIRQITGGSISLIEEEDKSQNVITAPDGRRIEIVPEDNQQTQQTNQEPQSPFDIRRSPRSLFE